MEMIFRLGACAVVGAVCYRAIEKQAGEIASLLAVALCGVLLWGISSGMTAVLVLIRSLAEAAHVENALLEPLLKTVGISIVTSLSAQVCRDAGVGSAATVMELCGGFCALYAALPLVETVLSLIQEIM